MLLILVILEGWGSLVDFSSKSKVGSQNTSSDVLVVSLKEVSNCLWGLGVKWRHGVLESDSLLQDPSESALFDEEASRKLTQKSGIDLAEINVELEIFGKESVPLSVALGEQ